jgi:hypothetical protein
LVLALFLSECEGAVVEADWPAGLTSGGVAALIGERVACTEEEEGLEKFTISPRAFLMTIGPLFLGGSLKLGFKGGGSDLKTEDGIRRRAAEFVGGVMEVAVGAFPLSLVGLG